jgi:predicted cupin superfamily sugar epimerase
MYNSNYFIKTLNMSKHPEGGYFKQSFVSDEILPKDVLENRFESSRTLWSSIYFLLNAREVSNFHRLKSDELWYFHAGSPLTIYMISPQGILTKKELGINILNGEVPQVLVPKDYIFGSSINHKGFSLVGCMVSPGFDFKDFELFERNDLIKKFPKHKDIIEKLT